MIACLTVGLSVCLSVCLSELPACLSAMLDGRMRWLYLDNNVTLSERYERRYRRGSDKYVIWQQLCLHVCLMECLWGCNL